MNRTDAIALLLEHCRYAIAEHCEPSDIDDVHTALRTLGVTDEELAQSQ